MKIIIGTEHAGADYARRLTDWLDAAGHETELIGENESRQGYPAVAETACLKGLTQAADLTVLICGTGIGMCMAAGKIPGVRAALCTDAYMGKMAKMHNNAKVLVFGARVIGFEHMLDILKTYMQAEYEKGRHQPRIAALLELERKYMK